MSQISITILVRITIEFYTPGSHWGFFMFPSDLDGPQAPHHYATNVVRGVPVNHPGLFSYWQKVFHHPDFNCLFKGGENDLLPVRMNTQTGIFLI